MKKTLSFVISLWCSHCVGLDPCGIGVVHLKNKQLHEVKFENNTVKQGEDYFITISDVPKKPLRVNVDNSTLDIIIKKGTQTGGLYPEVNKPKQPFPLKWILTTDGLGVFRLYLGDDFEEIKKHSSQSDDSQSNEEFQMDASEA